jgi:hypothetical protein
MRSIGKPGVWFALAMLALAAPAAAQLPDAKTLLAEVGLTPAQVSQVMSGRIVRGAIQAASERELVAALAFQMPRSPVDLVAEIRGGLGNEIDPETLAWSAIASSPRIEDFAKLTLEPGTAARARAYLTAAPGGSLNLSSAEIASFQALAKTSPSDAAVVAAVRNALLARVKAYQQKGLDGIEPYALAGGRQRSPAEELRTATAASKALQRFVPRAYQMLNDYPASRPPGTEETFRWTHFMAHGSPAIALVHHAFVPDGDAWLVVQRMFYVSTGFNSTQALAALIPVEGGTVVVYGNRTSTDQVTGFGGSARRSIGGRVLVSQLEGLFQKARTTPAR